MRVSSSSASVPAFFPFFKYIEDACEPPLLENSKITSNTARDGGGGGIMWGKRKNFFFYSRHIINFLYFFLYGFLTIKFLNFFYIKYRFLLFLVIFFFFYRADTTSRVGWCCNLWKHCTVRGKYWEWHCSTNHFIKF